MSNRKKNGLLLLLLGIFLLASAGFLHVTQLRQDQLAGENARLLLKQLELSRPQVQLPQSTGPTLEPSLDPLPELIKPQTPQPMAEKEYLGYSMIGTVSVPELDLRLPVLSSWSYELLNVAPCRYSGSLPEENLIILGHNYRSHFTPLHRAKVGMTVEFEDVNGQVTTFTVAEITLLAKTDGHRLPSDYPLTLFTCSADGQERLILRCR